MTQTLFYGQNNYNSVLEQPFNSLENVLNKFMNEMSIKQI